MSSLCVSSVSTWHSWFSYYRSHHRGTSSINRASPLPPLQPPLAASTAVTAPRRRRSPACVCVWCLVLITNYTHTTPRCGGGAGVSSSSNWWHSSTQQMRRTYASGGKSCPPVDGTHGTSPVVEVIIADERALSRSKLFIPPGRQRGLWRSDRRTKNDRTTDPILASSELTRWRSLGTVHQRRLRGRR